MKKFNKNLNRRDFVKTTAGSLAAASMVNSFSQRALAQETNFKRVIFWYVPEGCAQQAFWPAQEGKLVINGNASIDGKNPRSNNGNILSYVDPTMASYCLQHLARHVDDISLYSGFQNQDGPVGDAHASAVEGAMTGGTSSEGSIDQILAKHMQGDSPISSIYTAVYGHHVHDRGAADKYMSPVRAIGGGTIGSANWNPMDVYIDLFSDGIPAPNTGGMMNNEFSDSKAGRLAILQSAEAQLELLKCKGGEQARIKLESLLQSYSKLEQTTQRIIDSDNGLTGGADARFDIPDGWLDASGTRQDTSKYWNQSDSFGKMVDIAIDTTIAALALDRTRVSTLQFSASGTNVGPAQKDHYTKVGIQGLEGNTQDHYLGHDSNQVRRRDQARIYRWYYGKLAELIDKLKAFPDGEGSLFDSTLIVTCSEFGMYNHRTQDIPHLIAGGLNGKVKTGQYLNVSNGNTFRRNADLFLGVAKALDVELDHFGKSTNPFTEFMV